MKKTGSVLIAVFLSAVICMTAASALTDYSGGVTEYTLDDYDISVVAPDNWMSFTWDVEEDDESLNVRNTTREKLLTYFQENDIIYEAAYPEKGTIDLVFRENSDTQHIYDLCYLTDSLLHVMGKAMVAGEYENEKDGFTYSKYDLYFYNETQYIVLDFTESKSNDKQGVLYYTVTDGKEYRFILTSEKGKASDELRDALKAMIDNTTYYYDDNLDDEPEYNSGWDEYIQNHPEEFEKAIGTAGSFGIAAFLAVIIGFLVFGALIVLIVVLAVRSGNKNRAMAQDFEIRTGPDGRQYYYPRGAGMPQAGGAYQPPCPPQPVQPLQNEEKNNEQENPYDNFKD